MTQLNHLGTYVVDLFTLFKLMNSSKMQMFESPTQDSTSLKLLLAKWPQFVTPTRRSLVLYGVVNGDMWCFGLRSMRGVKQSPNKLCPSLLLLVFLHTFFGLAQVLQETMQPGLQCSFRTSTKVKNLLLFKLPLFQASVSCITSTILNPQPPL